MFRARVAIVALVAGALAAGARPAAAAPAPPGLRPPSGRGQTTEGRFLVATETLQDPNFSRTVILMLSHDAEGAMGVVLNRPSDIGLRDAVPGISELRGRDDRLFFGGPVGLNLMIVLLRSARQPKEARRVFGDVYVTGSLAALREALVRKGKVERLRAFVGHAGWAPGQLENEIARGDWRVIDADPRLIFDTAPGEVWPKLHERTEGEWTRRDDGRMRILSAACAVADLPLVDFEDRLDFHGDVERQLGHADRRSCVTAGFAEHLDEQG